MRISDWSSDVCSSDLKLGGLGGIMGMLPGVGKLQKQMAGANIDDRVLKRQEAIISSMTRDERRNPKLMNASRRKRVAAGSGTQVQDVNKVLKQHQDKARKIGRASGGERVCAELTNREQARTT